MKTHIYTEEQMHFFPLYAQTTDIEHKQEPVIRKDGYQDNQIFLVCSGCAILNINNESYILNENDLFYIKSDIPHEYYGTDENFCTSYLSFSGEGFDKIQKYYGLSDYGVYKNKNRGWFKASVKKLFSAMNSTMKVSGLCALAFSTVIDFFDEVCEDKFSAIENVYNYLEINYSKMITLEDILSVFPYSKAKLCRDFKSCYNATIFEKLTQIRLAHADMMIKNNPHLKLNTIALSCGFNDTSYFCKMYKKFYSHSPKSIPEKK